MGALQKGQNISIPTAEEGLGIVLQKQRHGGGGGLFSLRHGRQWQCWSPPGLSWSPRSPPLHPSLSPLFLPGPSQINQVVSHPNQPLTITAHDDRGIRFLDNRTGEAWPLACASPCAHEGGVGQTDPEPGAHGEALCTFSSPCLPGRALGKGTCHPRSLLLGKSVHSMVAHLDAVTCLAVDPNGVFLMSGSKLGPCGCPLPTR